MSVQIIFVIVNGDETMETMVFSNSLIPTPLFGIFRNNFSVPWNVIGNVQVACT